MAIPSFFFFIFSLFFSYQQSVKVCVLGGKLVSDTQFEYVLSLDSLMSMPTCQSRTTPPPGIGREYGVALIPSRGPCSPLPKKRDPSEGSSIGNSLAGTRPQKKPTSVEGEDVTVPIEFEKYQYLVQVGIGQPTRGLNLIMDTGSDITWTQCMPCLQKPCIYYKQKNPYFDTTKSSTFSLYGPNSPYNISYLDMSHSAGYVARDTLIIGSKNISNFIFGCGQNSSGRDNFAMADGIFGLAINGQHTFLSQTSTDLRRTFCFCIPPKDSSVGRLFLGDDAHTDCQIETYTPLISDSEYFVNLHGITIGNHTINFGKSTRPYITKTLIDSGTAITRLRPGVYEKLRSKFREYMSSKYPVAERYGIMDTCYHVNKSRHVALPKIVLHFDQANVTLDRTGVVSLVNNSICLAFARRIKPFNIIGGAQMRKLNVLFDGNARKIGFGRGSCAN